MFDIEGIQKRNYEKRIGKVYGTWKVVEVVYDREKGKQKWVLECVHCGKRKETYNTAELKKGKWGKRCECMNKSRNVEITYQDKAKTHIGEIHNDKEIIGYENGKYILKCIKCGRICNGGVKPSLEDRLPKCVCSVNQIKYDENYIGKRYGHLEVIAVERMFMCQKNCIVFRLKCDCGEEIIKRPVDLEKGNILCCGRNCKYKNENIKTVNGESSSPLYQKWNGMKQRCENPNSISYSLYGGRGIKVCEEWHDFFKFKEWSLANGYKEGLTIDRIDPDGNYEPSNCRYITLAENSSLARPRYSVRHYLKK